MTFDIKISKAPRSAKYVLLAFTFVTAVLLLIHSGIPVNVWLTRDENIKTTEHISIFRVLAEDTTTCFKKYEQVQSIYDDPVKSLERDKTKPSFFSMLDAFNKLMESLRIKAAIIEPSVLHCLLERKYQDLLSQRNFNLTNFMGLNTIITYGIIEDGVAVLQKEDNIGKFRNSGFQPYFVEAYADSWMNNSIRLGSEKYISHVFYNYFAWTIHIVVFKKRNNFLWHSQLNSYDELNMPKKTYLLYVNYDSAYENFTFIPPFTKWPGLSNFYIPSSSHYFLFQIPNSRFLECNLTRAANVKSSNSSPTAHSNLSVEKFNNRTLIALRELKTFFNSLLMNFWIFSGTMLGWYRQCDIIPYTNDVDFGAWASEINDLDYIIKYFRENKNVTIIERMGLLEEALEFQLRCDGLRVDVFFMYQINNGSWASGHRPSKGYYFRYYYPPFTLCSAELLEEKVQVPCETEDVILAEYGSNWMIPKSSWYYESSIKNRGPNIYWDEKRLKKAFEEY